MKRAAQMKVREAEAEVERDRWACDCGYPVDDAPDAKHCRSCRTYWEDVSNGLFDYAP